MRIYVETLIRGDIDELWAKTQTPELHQQWDARFSSIEYLPRDTEDDPQQFLYSTRLGFGLRIDGGGETVGNREGEDGRRSSSLRFWSDDSKSLIRRGAGYWQYVPAETGVRFLTGYDYQTRFGWLGSVADRFVFRPLMGWATAWSFDRLRLWMEKGIPPATSMQHALIHFVCRWIIAMVWIYQGLVPKILAKHSDELIMLADSGIGTEAAPAILLGAGVAEVALGLAVLFFFHHRWPLIVTMLLMVVATTAVAVNSPDFLYAAFNPVMLNLLLATVAWIAFFVSRDLPSARHCLRQPGAKE